MEAHQAHAEISGEADEHGVDEEEVECPEEVKQMSAGKTEACRTEWWHEGCGNGYAWDDVALSFGTQGEDACCTAEGGYQHVVDGWRGACEQFRLCLAERSDKEINRGSEDAYHGGDGKILCRPSQQLEVVDAYGESHADDRSHKGRDKHGADDDGGGVDIESERRYEDGEDKYPEVGSPEAHATGDLCHYLFLVFHVLHHREVCLYLA